MKKYFITLLTFFLLLPHAISFAASTEAALIYAAKSGNVKKMEAMLSEGLSIETTDKSGSTLLLLAASSRRYPAVSYLIDNGASVKAADKSGNTILHILASNSRKESVELAGKALDRGADIHSLNYRSPRQTPSEIAVRYGNIPMLELFLSRGVRSDYYFGSVPMIVYAYEVKQLKTMKFLAEKGSSVNSSKSSKETLLHLAAARNDTSTINFLLDNGAIIERTESSGKTPLLVAIEKKYFNAAELLLKRGASGDATGHSGKNIMHMLAEGKYNGKYITLFSKYTKGVNGRDNYGMTPLMTAITAKRWENVNPLIDAGADYSFTDSNGKTLLIIAIETGNSSIAAKTVEKGIDLNKKDTSGRSALHFAVSRKGRIWDNLIALIIEKGGNPNVYDSEKRTPAGLAIDSYNSSGLSVLISKGLDLNLKEKGTDPIAMYAYRKNFRSAFTELVKKGADISQTDGEGNSMLHLAAEKGDIRFYSTLLPLNPDLNIRNNAGRTPLMLSIESKNLTFAKKLLESKEKINLSVKDSNNMSIAHFLAPVKGSISILNSIEITRQQATEKDNSGRSPLALAVHAGLTDNADFFIKNGADPNGEDWQSSKLVIAGYSVNKNMMNLLLQNGADPGAVNPDGKTLLYLAIEKNDLGTVKLLFEKKADINRMYAGGILPLNHSIDKWRSSITQFLVSSGANLALKDGAGNTPLITAVKKKDYRTVSLLLQNGAKAEDRDSEGKSAVLISYESNKPDIFNLLLSSGAKSDEKFSGGNTLLHLSAQGNRLSFITAIVKNSGNLNSVNDEGKTPLMLASEKGFGNSVRAILAGGADAKMKDRSGESALYKCIKTGGQGGFWCAGYLIKGGADINDTTPSGNPLLHEAAALEKFDIVDLFLKSGGNPDILNQRGETLIMLLSKTSYSGTKDRAKSQQAAKLILELTSKGSNANIADKYGRKPLDIACRVKNTYVIEALLKGGANVNGTDSSGNTALKKAVMDYTGDYRVSEKEKKSTLQIIDLLIKNGCDINLKDKFGRTALSHILKEANARNYQKVTDLVPALIDRGASMDIRDNEGKSGADYALGSSIDEIKKFAR